jgi:nitrate reductase NapAB chaperone NapD
MIPIGFMFIQCREGSEDGILDKIRSIFGVVYVYKLDKSYDLVVKIESNSDEKFTSAISAIRKVYGILNTDTMVGFKE